MSPDDICSNCFLNMESGDTWETDLDYELRIPTLRQSSQDFLLLSWVPQVSGGPPTIIL